MDEVDEVAKILVYSNSESDYVSFFDHYFDYSMTWQSNPQKVEVDTPSATSKAEDFVAFAK